MIMQYHVMLYRYEHSGLGSKKEGCLTHLAGRRTQERLPVSKCQILRWPKTMSIYFSRTQVQSGWVWPSCVLAFKFCSSVPLCLPVILRPAGRCPSHIGSDVSNSRSNEWEHTLPPDPPRLQTHPWSLLLTFHSQGKWDGLAQSWWDEGLHSSHGGGGLAGEGWVLAEEKSKTTKKDLGD